MKVRLVNIIRATQMFGCSTAFLLLQGCDEPVPEPVAKYATETAANSLSTLEIMQLVIAPATDTLWGVGNPQSDEDWAELEQAAAATMAGALLTAIGGSGPQDAEWASSSAYQAMNTLMLDAAKASLEAVRAKDLDALLDAGDVLYPPCEVCHLQFNPGVINLPE